MLYNRISLKLKIYIISMIVSILVIVTYSSIHSFIFAKEAEKLALNTALSIIDKKQKLIDRFFKDSQNTLVYINRSKVFRNYLKKQEDIAKDNLDEFIFHIMSIDKKYLQIRFIDAKGHEKIKVKKVHKNSYPQIISGSDLQDKSNRYYFQQTKDLKRGEFWFSRLDLNIENGKIEIPYQPTLRVVYPVYFKDKFEGVLVVNFAMDEFINQLSKSPLYAVILCDNKGFTIFHYKKEKSWGIHKQKRYNIKEEYPIEYKKILSLKNYKSDKFVSVAYDLPINNGLVMVIQLKKEYIEFQKGKNYEEMFLTSLIVLLISFVGSFILISIVQKVLLHKDNMIVEQNKLASMGQMLENIAHQWRQPLAQINSIVYSMDYEINKKDTNKEILLNELDKIETVTTYLSQTINDFKDFLKLKKEKESFSLNESFYKTASIVSGSFSNADIDIKINLNSKIKIYNYQSLFEQSVLSILNNAKDVLVQNEIIKPVVTIDVIEDKDEVQVLIQDNGGGITTKPLEKIFEPYFTTKQHSKGSGLGLYIAKMMIEDLMDGTIVVQNTKDGALFKIVLLKGL